MDLKYFMRTYIIWYDNSNENLIFFGYDKDNIFGTIQIVNEMIYIRIDYHKDKDKFYETYLLNDQNLDNIKKALNKCLNAYYFNKKKEIFKKIINLKKNITSQCNPTDLDKH